MTQPYNLILYRNNELVAVQGPERPEEPCKERCLFDGCQGSCALHESSKREHESSISSLKYSKGVRFEDQEAVRIKIAVKCKMCYGTGTYEIRFDNKIPCNYCNATGFELKEGELYPLAGTGYMAEVRREYKFFSENETGWRSVGKSEPEYYKNHELYDYRELAMLVPIQEDKELLASSTNEDCNAESLPLASS